MELNLSSLSRNPNTKKDFKFFQGNLNDIVLTYELLKTRKL